MPAGYKIRGIAPHELRNYPDAVKLQFWGWVVEYGLRAKDRDLARGLDAAGEPLRPILPETRKHRRSEMTPSGKGDPSAPPLMPGRKLSRTRSLLAGRAFTTHAEFYWRYDAWTGDTWAVILTYHKRMGRDVFGLSDDSLDLVRRQANARWMKWKREGGAVPAALAGKRVLGPAPGVAPKFEPAGRLDMTYATLGINVPADLSQRRGGMTESELKAYYRGTAAASVQGRPSAGYNRLLAHVWGQGPTAGGAVVPMPPTPPKKPGYTSPGAFDLPMRGIRQPKTPPEELSRYIKKPPTIAEMEAMNKEVVKALAEGTESQALVDKFTAMAKAWSEAHPGKSYAEELAKYKAATAPPIPPKPKAPPKPKPSKFPDVAAVEEVRTLGGSTGAKLVKDKSGKLWVMKRGANPGHLAEEAHADALYRAMGVDVPRSIVRQTPSGPVKFSEFHEGKTLGDLRESDPDAYQAAKLKLREHYVADALLGNWDVIGASADNILVTPDGRVLRIDNGGSLRYRAMGSLKSSGQWTGTVSELGSLKDPNINPAAGKIFAGITDDQIKAQIKAITARKAAIVKAAPEELRATLAARIDDLKKFGKPIKVGNWKPAPAENFRSIPADELHKWGEEHYKEWRENLSPPEKAAVKSYTGSGYRKLNQYLRGASPGPPDNAGIVPDLDRALEAKPVPHDLIVYRGTYLGDVLKGTGLSSRDQLKPGMDLPDAGYTSTSPVFGSAWSGEKFEIRVAKGTPGAWVDPISTHKGEKEFLLGRDVDTFRIVEVKLDRIVVEALQSAKLPKGRKRKGKGE